MSLPLRTLIAAVALPLCACELIVNFSPLPDAADARVDARADEPDGEIVPGVDAEADGRVVGDTPQSDPVADGGGPLGNDGTAEAGQPSLGDAAAPSEGSVDGDASQPAGDAAQPAGDAAQQDGDAASRADATAPSDAAVAPDGVPPADAAVELDGGATGEAAVDAGAPTRCVVTSDCATDAHAPICDAHTGSCVRCLQDIDCVALLAPALTSTPICLNALCVACNAPGVLDPALVCSAALGGPSCVLTGPEAGRCSTGI